MAASPKPEPVILKNRNPVPDKSGTWARYALGAPLVMSLGVLVLYRWLGDNPEPPIEPVGVGENVTVKPVVNRPAADQIVVYVVGEVNRPGVVSLPAGSRVVDAIKAAGGLTERANQFGVNLAARLHDEEMVKVYAQGEAIPEMTATPAAPPVSDPGPGPDEPPPLPPQDPVPAPPDLTPPPPAGHFQGGEIPPPAPPVAAANTPAPAPATPSGDSTPAPAAPPKAGPKVSLNRGTVEQLEAIPGVGPKLAAQIVAYRRGPPARAFTTLEDLTRVPGIKQAKLDELRSFITL